MKKCTLSRKYIICGCFVAVFAVVYGQNLETANAYYAGRAYAKAIPIFEVALAKKNNPGIKSKLANCYRILNKPEKALPLYADIAKDDKPAQKDLLHYAEVLMNVSRYEEAKVWLKKYNIGNPDDAPGKLLLDNCDKIKNIHPLFPNIVITPFSKNDNCDDNAPVFYRNGIVYASDRNQSFKLLKEKNPQTGRDFFALYYSEPVNDNEFSEPRIFSSKLMDLNSNTSNASFTKSGERIYFCKNNEEAAKNGIYNMQIYTAESENREHWKNITRLDFCSSEFNYMYPAISPDGNLLFYVTDKGAGYGGLDIYMTRKTKKGWSHPENLGPKVNTSAHECFPFYSDDRKLYFSSKGHAGFGGYDIFYTTYDSVKEVWQTPVNLGAPINSAYDDISISFSNAGLNAGAFTSSRGGNGDDIYFFKLNSKSALPDNSVQPLKEMPKGFSIEADDKKKKDNHRR